MFAATVMLGLMGLPASKPPSLPPNPLIGKAFRVSKDRQFALYGATSATWLGGVPGDLAELRRVMAEARRAGSVPVLVQYVVPGRDRDGGSRGGAADPKAYQALVDSFAQAIGDAPAIMVVEPDALPLGLDPAAVKLAVGTYKRRCKAARVYLDAGHSNWRSARQTAELLIAGGIADAAGFSLNVSAFEWTRDALYFGDTVREALGWKDPALASKTFVVDTSRNGAGPGVDENGKPTWGDPVKAGGGGPILNGPLPTWVTDHPGCDAFLWIKGPGYGDNRTRPATEFGGAAWVTPTAEPKLAP